MVNKHFLKRLTMFLGIIIIGLLGVFLVSYFDVNQGDSATVDESDLIAN